MIRELSNGEIYRYANSGCYELLRDSLLSMKDGSYDNSNMYSTKGFYIDENLIGIYSERLIDKPIPEAFHLGFIEINHKYRNKGYGSLLMNYIIEDAKKSGYNKFTLRAHDESRLKFYNDLGFELINDPKYPRLLMIKELS